MLALVPKVQIFRASGDKNQNLLSILPDPGSENGAHRKKKTAMQTNNKSQSLLVFPAPRFYFSFSSRRSLPDLNAWNIMLLSLSPNPVLFQAKLVIELSRATFFSPTLNTPFFFPFSPQGPLLVVILVSISIN